MAKIDSKRMGKNWRMAKFPMYGIWTKVHFHLAVVIVTNKASEQIEMNNIHKYNNGQFLQGHIGIMLLAL